MKEQKLISMTDFVLEKSRKYNSACWDDDEEVLRETFEIIENYANFLKQPLTLGMFVPCGENGEVLEEPKHYNEWLSEQKRGFDHDYESKIMKQYQQAKGRVLFELHRNDFEFIQDVLSYYDDVEELTGMNVTLTPNAIKQIGL